MIVGILVGVVLIYYITLIPVQYHNITETKKQFAETNKTHNEVYDEMSFEEQQLQYNLQGSLINLPATLVAMLIYKIRHRN